MSDRELKMLVRIVEAMQENASSEADTLRPKVYDWDGSLRPDADNDLRRDFVHARAQYLAYSKVVDLLKEMQQ